MVMAQDGYGYGELGVSFKASYSASYALQENLGNSENSALAPVADEHDPRARTAQHLRASSDTTSAHGQSRQTKQHEHLEAQKQLEERFLVEDDGLVPTLKELRHVLSSSEKLDARALAHSLALMADECERLDPPEATRMLELTSNMRTSLYELANAARAADATLVRPIASHATAAAHGGAHDDVSHTCRGIISHLARFRSSHIGSDYRDADECARWLDEVAEHADPSPNPYQRFSMLWQRLISIEVNEGLPDRLRDEMARVESSDPRGAFTRLYGSAAGTLQRRAAAADVASVATRLDDIAAYIASGHMPLRLDTSAVHAIVQDSEEMQSALVCCRMASETAARVVERLRRGDDARRSALRGISKALRLLGAEYDSNAAREVTQNSQQPVVVPKLRLPPSNPETRVDVANTEPPPTTLVARWRSSAPHALPLLVVVLGGLAVLSGGAWLAATLLGLSGDATISGGLLLCGVLLVVIGGVAAAYYANRSTSPDDAPVATATSTPALHASASESPSKSGKLSARDALRLAEDTDSAQHTPRPPSATRNVEAPAPRPFAVVAAADMGYGAPPTLTSYPAPAPAPAARPPAPAPAPATISGRNVDAMNASMMRGVPNSGTSSVPAMDASARSVTMNASARSAANTSMRGGGMSFSGRSVQPEDIMSSQTFIGPPIWMAAAGGSGGGFGGGGNSRGDDTARTHVPVPPPPRTDGIVARPTGSRRVRQSTQTTAQT